MRFDSVVEALTYTVGEAYIRMGNAEQRAVAAIAKVEALEANKAHCDEEGFTVTSYRNIARRAKEECDADDKLIGQCEVLLGTIRTRM